MSWSSCVVMRPCTLSSCVVMRPCTYVPSQSLQLYSTFLQYLRIIYHHPTRPYPIVRDQKMRRGFRLSCMCMYATCISMRVHAGT